MCLILQNSPNRCWSWAVDLSHVSLARHFKDLEPKFRSSNETKRSYQEKILIYRTSYISKWLPTACKLGFKQSLLSLNKLQTLLWSTWLCKMLRLVILVKSKLKLSSLGLDVNLMFMVSDLNRLELSSLRQRASKLTTSLGQRTNISTRLVTAAVVYSSRITVTYRHAQ